MLSSVKSIIYLAFAFYNAIWSQILCNLHICVCMQYNLLNKCEAGFSLLCRVNVHTVNGALSYSEYVARLCHPVYRENPFVLVWLPESFKPQHFYSRNRYSCEQTETQTTVFLIGALISYTGHCLSYWNCVLPFRITKILYIREQEDKSRKKRGLWCCE